MTYFVPVKGMKSAKNRKIQPHKLEGIKTGKYLWMKFKGPQAPSGAESLKSASVPKGTDEFLHREAAPGAHEGMLS